MSESTSTLRAAVALNNAGVGLMERGHVKRALRLFQNSTAVLLKQQQRHPRRRHPTTGASCSGKRRIQDELRRAEILLASVKASSKTSLVEVVALEDDDDTGQHDAILYGASSSILFPMRLRHVTTDQTRACGDSASVTCAHVRYQTAVVLYNFGLASRYRALHHQASSSCGIDTFQAGAVQALRSAREWLIQCAECQVPLPDIDDLYRWDLMLQLVNLSLHQVTNTMMVVSAAAPPPRESLVSSEDAPYVQQVCDRDRKTHATAA